MSKHIPSPISEKVLELDVRVTRVEKKTESHDSYFERIEKKFDSVETRLDSVEARLGALEVKVDSLCEMMIEQNKVIEEMQRKLEKVFSFMEGLKIVMEKR